MRVIYLFSILSLFLLGACSNSSTGISGTITGAENLSVYFDKVFPDGNNMSITQTPADANGNFKFSFEEPISEGVYRVRVGAKYAILIIKEGDSDIKINGSLNDLANFNYKVEGSPESIVYRDANSKLASGNINLDQMKVDIEETHDPLVAMQLTSSIFKGRLEFVSTYMKVNQKLKEAYPDSDFTLRHTQFVDQMNTTIARTQRSRRGKFKVGDVAPEIALPGPDGKIHKLSDLKGEVVLIDFWASWCGPCRKDNPKIVATYNKYRDKGFNIFSVSLDGIHPRLLSRYKTQSEIDAQIEKARQKWIAAIEKDKLTWDSHVSELKHWNSNVSKLYGVSSIPQSFLIDQEGKIAAVNPRYTLEEELQKIFKS